MAKKDEHLPDLPDGQETMDYIVHKLILQDELPIYEALQEVGFLGGFGLFVGIPVLIEYLA
jgi:hypothetical protein